MTTCLTLEEVRHNIDRLDRQLLGLIVERGCYVKQAARFKKSADELAAPLRVAQVMTRLLALAPEYGADPHVVEATWRAMIGAFIEAEQIAHASLHPPQP